MTTIPEEVAKTLIQRLIDGAIGEVNYFCCFRTHVANFEKKRNLLAAKKGGVLKDIEDAKKRNETQVEDDVHLWLNETNVIIDEDTRTNMKCFHGWCPNCIWRYKQGKKLAEKIPDITDLIERCNNFDKVARLAQPPGITYYSPQNFIDFDSRRSTLKNLVDILHDGSYSLIGLHGLGGTGKTTLATKVGHQVEESKAFQKVIFVVVSNPPDINKIRQNIAGQLELELKEAREVNSKDLWARIAKYEGMVLIILDDVWQWLDLKDIGIPYGQNHKNCCVLITTRDVKVCEEMKCQRKVALETLTEDDALNLFIKQFGERSNDSSSEFMDLAGGIAKECGGLPLAVVAVATILKGWPLRDWKSALKTLQKSEPLHNVHKDLVKVYTSLKLSYDNLEKKAQCLLLLCSIFPEDFEIPIDLLSKLGIGLGLFGGVNSYFEVRRREVIAVKNDLINSSLLLEAGKVCVKMHDLVREVALWIADENVQVIINSNATIKSNLQFLFWHNDEFPNCFEATKLEVLIIYIDGEAKVRDATIFEGMAHLKVLFIEGPYIYSSRKRKSFTPLLGSLLSLKNIRTLIIRNWKLGDISILKGLKFLETFELENCTITELSEGFSKLTKMKLLGLRRCHIGRGNPFEVIERCSRLEELYFVRNYGVKHWKLAENTDEVAQDICSPMLQRYSIACSEFEGFDDVDGLLNCLNIEHATELISESMFNDLMGRAEVLEFRETGEAQWKSLVHGKMMNDLIQLRLCDLDDIRCLIDTDTPDGSFRQLQILKLQNCEKLKHLCFDGNLKLPHLKSLHLEDCPMLEPSIFQLQPSVALCVERLEELLVENCEKLRSLIAYESLEEEKLVNVDQQKSYCSSFQKLKCLQILNCGKLEFVLPLFPAGEFPLLEDLSIKYCKEVKYIFAEYREEGHTLNQHIILPSLTYIELEYLPSFIGMVRECKICTQRSSCAIIVKDDSKEKQAIPFSRAFGCCFPPTTKGIDIEVSSSSSQNLKATKESYGASSKRIETFHTAECLIRQPLSLQNLRDMRLIGCSKLKSLFSVSIASSIMLEMLIISECEELKYIITNDEEDDGHLNYTSIFPKLENIGVVNCHNLEFIFPSTLLGGLQKLQIIDIKGACLLKYVFGAYNEDQNMKAVPINLPALERLALATVPDIISLCSNNYYVVWPPLRHIILGSCWGVIRSTLPYFMASHQGRQLELNIGKGLITGSSLFPDFMICLQSRQPNMETYEDYMKITMSMQNLISLTVGQSETIEEILNVEGIQSKGPVTLSLEKMELDDLVELRHIYKDPNNILRLLHLKVLRIHRCGKLRALFTTSTAKSLPRLSSLQVMDCIELVHIIEENDNDETSACGGGSHQLCFPMLESIEIYRCHGLRSLFSISTTSTMLPNLKTLIIEEASRLEEVFRCQQYDTQEISIQNVFPNLSTVALYGLMEVRTICRGINFHSVPKFKVKRCPKFSEYESPTEELYATDRDSDQIIDSENESPTEELYATDSDYDQIMSDLEQKIETQELATSASPNFTETEELQDVHIRREPTMQLQRQDLGETKTTTKAPHKSNTPSDYDDLMKTKSRRETIMTHQQELEEMTTENAVEGFPKYSEIMKTCMITTSTLLIDGQPKTEQDLVDQLNSREATSGIKVPHQANTAIMEEAVKQSYQEQDRSMEVIAPTNSNKDLHHNLEPGKEDVGIATTSTSTTASTNSKSAIESFPDDTTTVKGKISTPPIDSLTEGLQTYPPAQVTPSIEGTLEQGPQQNYAAEEVTIANKSIDLDPKRQSRLVILSEKENAKTNKETRNASDLEGHKAEKATEADLSTQSQSYSPKTTNHNTILADVIHTLQHQPQIAVAGSSSPTLEIGEIMKLVELKESEQALLTNALERYPKLKLPRERRTNRIIALSYQVLVDVLIMLTTKTPYTITASDRSILEDNLGEAMILGFDNGWIESVRAKIYRSDTLDVLVAEKEMKDMEAKLETCEMALDDVRKQRVVLLEEFDSRLFGLLEDRKKLVMKMEEIRGFMSSKDKPFGF